MRLTRNQDFYRQHLQGTKRYGGSEPSAPVPCMGCHKDATELICSLIGPKP